MRVELTIAWQCYRQIFSSILSTAVIRAGGQSLQIVTRTYNFALLDRQKVPGRRTISGQNKTCLCGPGGAPVLVCQPCSALGSCPRCLGGFLREAGRCRLRLVSWI